MKTDFEELYSKIFYSNALSKDDIRFFYIDREGLRSLDPYDILDKREGMLRISRFHMYTEELEVVEIPIHSIRVIVHRDQGILLDRRDSYQGNKSLDLPENVF